MRAYRAANRERINAQRAARRAADGGLVAAKQRAYAEANRARIREVQRAWRAANPDRCLQYSRKWNDANREHRAECLRAYRAKNRERFIEWGAARRAREAGAPVVEKIDRAAIIARDRSICHICGLLVSDEAIHLDHVIPLAARGEHAAANVKVAHASCNQSKNARVDELALYREGRLFVGELA